MNTTTGLIAFETGPRTGSNIEPCKYTRGILEEAGFLVFTPKTKRAPGTFFESPRDLLETSDLVVLDFSTVPKRAARYFERSIHCRRPPETTLLIGYGPGRSLPEGPNPRIIYDTVYDHGMKLREFLGLSHAVLDRENGRHLTFLAASRTADLADLFVAQALLSTLRELRFSGRFECYSDNQEEEYRVFLAVRETTRRLHETPDWWKALESTLSFALAMQNADIFLLESRSVVAPTGDSRRVMTCAGVVDFIDGRPRRVSNPRTVRHCFERLVLAELELQEPRLHRL
jgi:hypothetical protein